MVATAPASAVVPQADPPPGYATQMFKAVNKARATGRNCGSRFRKAAPKLDYNNALARAAQGHASDMSARDYFDHVSLDGRTFDQRIRAQGYRQPGGENIASGQQSVTEVMNAWLASPGHCLNIMEKDFKAAGFGYAVRNDPRYSTPVTYWVQEFGYK